jgi:hypothetical protein
VVTVVTAGTARTATTAAATVGTAATAGTTDHRTTDTVTDRTLRRQRPTLGTPTS